MATQMERLQKALESYGWERDLSHRTGRYRAMKPTATCYFVTHGGTMTARYFLGVNGAFRYSSLGKVTASVAHEKRKAKLLAKFPD